MMGYVVGLGLQNQELKIFISVDIQKVVAKLLISRTLTFNISATECPIEIKFSVLDSADQGLQHIPF